MYELIFKVKKTQYEQLHRLYKNEFWSLNRQVIDIERVLAGSTVVIGIEDGEGRLVGFCRLLSDKVYKATLYDLIVDAKHRGRGLGKRLIEAALEHPAVACVEHIDLDCLEEMIPFYQRWGFTSDMGKVLHMRRNRDRLRR